MTTHFALSCLILSCPIPSYPVPSCPVPSHPAWMTCQSLLWELSWPQWPPGWPSFSPHCTSTPKLEVLLQSQLSSHPTSADAAALCVPHALTHTVTCVGQHSQFLSSPFVTPLLLLPRHTAQHVHEATASPSKAPRLPTTWHVAGPGVGGRHPPCHRPCRFPEIASFKTAVMGHIYFQGAQGLLGHESPKPCVTSSRTGHSGHDSQQVMLFRSSNG